MMQVQFSVIMRAAEHYAGKKDSSPIEEAILALYPEGNAPFLVSPKYPLPLHLFSPRIRSFLLEDKDNLNARGIWEIICSREIILRMITATEMDRTAAEGLSSVLYRCFPFGIDQATNMKRKQMIGYMIKVAMELFGYRVYQQRMQISLINQYKDEERVKNYFTTASRYKKFSQQDIEQYLRQITDTGIKEVFSDIAGLICGAQTKYHEVYRLNDLAYWNDLYPKV